jgi:hypothetical protein
LGGTPSTALLHATSITAGWSGTLSGTRGGTGVNNGSNTATYAGSINFAGAFSTAGAFSVTQTYTASTSVTFPTSGTLATTSQLPTPAALTESNDTNVTLTLGGTPSSALLQAVSITAGWTGTLAPSRGGTGISSLGTGVATALAANVNGSGSISLTTSPAFVTPALGAATATSINFGGSTLQDYVVGTWTPIVTLGTGSGNVVPTYTTNQGNYTRIGNIVYCDVTLSNGAGGTAGAGTGQVLISLPITASGANNGIIYFPCGTSLNTSTYFLLYAFIASGATNLTMAYASTISSVVAFAGSNQNSASIRVIQLKFFYQV